MTLKNGKEIIVLIDLDGVVADWQLMFDSLIETHIPELEILRNEQITQFKAQELYPVEYRAKIADLMLMPGFYRNLDPIEGAVEVVKRLADKYTVFFCTAPLGGHETCASEKIQWVKHYFGDELSKRMVITDDKTLVYGDVLIDDRPDIYGAVEIPAWKHIVFNAPYNQGMEPRINQWFEAEDMLEKYFNSSEFLLGNKSEEAIEV